MRVRDLGALRAGSDGPGSAASGPFTVPPAGTKVKSIEVIARLAKPGGAALILLLPAIDDDVRNS